MHLSRLFATPGLQTRHHGARVRAQPVVQRKAIVVLTRANRNADLFARRIIMENSQLTLLVNRECSVIEALIVGPGFLDVTHVPFAYV